MCTKPPQVFIWFPQSLTCLQLAIFLHSSQSWSPPVEGGLFELLEQSVCWMDKSVREKDLMARKQEGTCPYIVLKVTSRATFCKVRGNSLSTVAQSMSFTGKFTYLDYFLCLRIRSLCGKEQRAGRPTSLRKLGQTSPSTEAQALQSSLLHCGNTLSKSS